MTLDVSSLTTIVALVGPAVGAVASYAVLRERVNRHDRSIENFGERLGAVEKRLERQDAELSRPILAGRDPAAPR